MNAHVLKTPQHCFAYRMHIASSGRIRLSRFYGHCRDPAVIPASGLERTPKLRRCDAHDTPEDLREMARAAVADFEPDLDEAARSFADQLLGPRNALAGHELQRSHAGGLLEDMGKMRRTQFHQSSESFN